MDRQKDTGFEAILEHLIEHGANDLARWCQTNSNQSQFTAIGRNLC